MTKQNGKRGGGWLPVLDAGQRFRPLTMLAGMPEGPERAESAALAVSESADTRETTSMDDTKRPTPVTGIDWSAELQTQFGISPMPAPVADEVAPEPVELTGDAATIAELRDRLAYYEHFDSLIRDNIARSAELFQAVFAEREKVRTERHVVESDVVSITAEIELRMNAERQHTQHILMSLMDEATFLQQRADALIQRIAEAVTEASARPDEDDEPVAGA